MSGLSQNFCRRTLRLAVLVAAPALGWTQGTYTTAFPLTENPISESGHWINGQTVGLDWTNVRTTAGLAFGTQTGTQTGSAQYSDSTAILSGTWGPNQTAQATVAVSNATNASNIYEEVELRLHTTITAHSITGYEVNCSVSTNSTNNYIQVVRWNGPLGSFTQIAGYQGHCVNGDILKATIDSSGHIAVYLNGSQVESVTDTTYSSGSPGIGFFLQGSTGLNANYGFSSYTTTDGSSSFTLSASPSTQTVSPGSPASYTATVAPSGSFSGTVTLSASGLPTGATATFNPTSITTSGSSTLTVNSASTSPTGSYTLTISGTSGSLNQTATAALVLSSSSACDVNRDGSVNVLDAQLAANNYVRCSTSAFQTFYSQVVTGALSSCPVSTGLHTVTLNWTASTTGGVTYNIYRATTSGGYNYAAPLNSAPITGTSFSDCTVSLGQLYYYVIRSVDGSGNQSANSPEITLSIPSY